MKKTTSKKLVVSRTTIRTLRAPELERVAGGQTLATCSELCTDVVCPDTQFIHGCNSGG